MQVSLLENTEMNMSDFCLFFGYMYLFLPQGKQPFPTVTSDWLETHNKMWDKVSNSETCRLLKIGKLDTKSAFF